MPKMYESLIMSITCYERKRRRKKHVYKPIEMVNGASDCRMSCTRCVYMANCTRNQSVLRVIEDHFKPKMVKCEFEQWFGICVKSLRHGFVTFWNVRWGSFAGTYCLRDFLSIKNDWTLVIPSPSSSSIKYKPSF